MSSSRRSLYLTFLFVFFGAIALVAQNPPTQFSPYNVRDFGAKGDGTTLDTAAIAKAIKTCNANGGGTVLFPPGTYLSGTIEILSNVTLDLEAGAVLQGSKNIGDYRKLTDFNLTRGSIGYGETSSGEGDLVGLIVSRNAHDIAIIGRGAIDGSGDDFMDLKVPHASMDFDPEATRNPKEFLGSVYDLSYGPVEPKLKGDGRAGTLLIFHECRNVLIRDITIRNAPNWTLHLQKTEQIVISGIHIVNNPLIPNNDGIDCMRCKHLHISDSDIQAGDDDFAIVNSENVNISNCSISSRSAAIRLEGTRDAVFNNLTVDTNRGIGVFQTSEFVTDNVLFSNITMRTHLIPGHWWGKAEPIYVAIRSCEPGKCKGGVRNVTFSNIIAEAEAGILIVGAKENPATNLTFDRVRVNIRSPRKDLANAVGGNFDLRWTATSPKEGILKHDIPGFYCSGVKGLRIKDFEIQWGDDLPGYFSDGIQCENFNEISVEDFSGRQAQAKGAAMNFANGSGLSITNSKAAPGTDAFVRINNVNDRRTFVNYETSEAKTVLDPPTATFKRTFGLRAPTAQPAAVKK